MPAGRPAASDPRGLSLSSMTAVEPDARPAPQPNVTPKPGSSPPRVCPYLTTMDGGWRSSTVARENRCGAVAPPAPLAAEKQRRLCLTADYPTCATFEAARAARPVAHDRTPLLPRPLARVAPVVLDHGRLSVGVPPVRADRTTVQAVLVVMLGLAFAALVLARLAGGQAPGGAAGSDSPSDGVAGCDRDGHRVHRGSVSHVGQQSHAGAHGRRQWRGPVDRRIPGRRPRRRTRSRPGTRWSASPRASEPRRRRSGRSTGWPARPACALARCSRSPESGSGRRRPATAGRPVSADSRGSTT